MAFSRRPLGILGILGISLALLLSTFPSRKSSELKRPSTRWWPLLSTGVPGLCTPHSRSRAQSLTPPSQAHTAHLAAQADAPCGSRIPTNTLFVWAQPNLPITHPHPLSTIEVSIILLSAALLVLLPRVTEHQTDHRLRLFVPHQRGSMKRATISSFDSLSTRP
ncbi:hypothetical protein CABS01_01779 [Colletotrichum abscissum]|uniref:uncharacterized protein n=1 Tax=Colletotrichum abscissum TaxID=1671311 RepID=UPI0027D71AA3|nr:uncharacterized protein CABS01_01779 [Colletotrichum abscissum]KAK1495972.1 hypothetical protein CABS01_01779 [Colletotrichum abscissum]